MFFTEEEMRRIRYLHFNIKKLEEAIIKDEETFSLDDLNYVLEYTKILNINYENQDQKRIMRDLDITQSFHDPEESIDIEIYDIMFECARTLWVLARAYSVLSENYEKDEEYDDAVLAMVESSKMYKTAAYFSAASTLQKERGYVLNTENLELSSEETRILAQSIAATREESSNNIYFASKLYAGLSALSKRLFYLRKHDEKKKQQIRAHFHYDMGNSCYLKAKASIESSITPINEQKVKKLKQKAKFYLRKAQKIWISMLEDLKALTNEERESINDNLTVVERDLKEIDDVKELSYEENLFDSICTERS
ncbi:MAG: hypothetical protein P8Y70_19390 [Candidatus Lokiarchaeota archaeon]